MTSAVHRATTATDALRVAVLGPCTIDGSSTPFVPSLIQRRILARLAVMRDAVVLVDELIEIVWAGQPPRTAMAALQNQIARLRSVLGRDAIATVASGYRLDAPTDIDALRAALTAAEASLRAGQHDAAEARATEGLALWRGRPVPELDHWTGVEGVRPWLLETHRALEDIRLAAAVAGMRLSWAIPEAERLVADHPDDERRWVMLIDALAHAGRRGDALAAVERARRHLADSLGLQPGADLRAAHQAVLSPTSAPSRTAALPLTGRDALLAELADRAPSGRPVLVTGEPGIGKTRVLDALARRLRRAGVIVTVGRCSTYPTSATATLAELAGGLGQTLHPEHPPRVALRTALRSAGSEQTRVALLVDDIDLAGPSTVDALVAAAKEPNVLVVATCSSELAAGLAADPDDVVVVPPFAADELDAMIHSALGRALTSDEPPVAWFSEMTGGNPAMLECLLDAMASDPAESAGFGVRSVAARDLVRRRLELLSPLCRSTIEVAAVLGTTCTVDLLIALAGRQGVDAALSSGVLVETPGGAGQLTFRHGAMERIVLADLPPGRRSDLHYHAALRLTETGGAIAAIATHAAAAGEIAPLETARFVVDAAREASERGAHHEAAAWYERAVAPARQAGAAGERLAIGVEIALADALRLAGEAAHGDRLILAADEAFALGDAQLVGEATWALLQLGESSDSGDLHNRAVALAERSLTVVTDPHLSACIAAAASLAHSMTGHPELCRDLFVGAMSRSVGLHTRRAVLPFAFLALGHPDDRHLRADVAAELLALGRVDDHAVTLFEALQLSFSVAIQRSDGASLQPYLTEMEQLVERVGDVGRRWSLLYQSAALAHIEGRLDDAEQLAADALVVFSPVSAERAMAAYGGQLLGIQMARGTVASLTDTLREMVATSPSLPAWNAALALALTDTAPDEAAHYARAALDNTVADFTWLAGQLIGGRAAASVADRVDVGDILARYVERLVPYAGTCCWQGTCTYGPVDTVLAMLAHAQGDDAGARRHAASAAALATSLRSPTFTADIENVVSSWG